MQGFLDQRKTMAFTMVDHLRWDLKQILDLAVAEDVIPRNPVYLSNSMLLFVPRECTQPQRPTMNVKEVRQAIAVLDLRERVVVKLAVIAGMRVSEIFGLRRGRVKDGYVEIKERVCKRDIDAPKTAKAVRRAALSPGLQQDLTLWLSSSPDTGPEGWLFPSEKLTTPIGIENMLNRYIREKRDTGFEPATSTLANWRSIENKEQWRLLRPFLNTWTRQFHGSSSFLFLNWVETG